MLPNLFIPGAPKAGTSSLHDYLSAHPDICMPPNKEPSYFWRTDKTLGDYAALFSKCENRKYRGDASTSYMVLPEVARKIREVTERPRFVFLLRNPVDRAWSHYWWAKGRYGYEKDDFRTAFQRNMEVEPSAADFIDNLNDFYFQCGLYSKWLKVFDELFDDSDIHIVIFEDLVSDPAHTLDGIYEFLGVEKIPFEKKMKSNPSIIVKYPILPRMHAAATRVFGNTVGLVLPPRLKYELILLNRKFLFRVLSLISTGNRPAMSPEERQWIAAFYRDEVGELRRMAGMALQQWSGDFGP